MYAAARIAMETQIEFLSKSNKNILMPFSHK